MVLLYDEARSRVRAGAGAARSDAPGRFRRRVEVALGFVFRELALARHAGHGTSQRMQQTGGNVRVGRRSPTFPDRCCRESELTVRGSVPADSGQEYPDSQVPKPP